MVFPGLNSTGSSRRTKTTPSKWPTHSGIVSDKTPIPLESHEPSLKATHRLTPSVVEQHQIKKAATAAAAAATAASPKLWQPEKNVDGTAEGPSVLHPVRSATKAVAHQLQSTSPRKDNEAAIAKKCGKTPRGNGRVSGSFASRRKSAVKKASAVLGEEEEEDFDDIFADGPRRDSLAGLEILTIGLRRNRTSVGAALKQVQ